MCSEMSFLQFAELQTDQGTLIFPMKNCSLDAFRSRCHTGSDLLAWSLHKVCLQCMRSEALTSHARCDSTMPPCPLALPLSIWDIWGLALGVIADHAGFECTAFAVRYSGWYPPWDALLPSVSEGPYTGPVQALTKYSSSNTVSPMWTQQHGSRISAVPLFSNHRVTQPQGHVSASPA